MKKENHSEGAAEYAVTDTNPVKKSKRKKASVFDVLNYAFFIIFALLCIFPVVYQLLLSFASKADYLQANASTVIVIPRHFNFENYKVTLYQDNILKAFGVSVFITVAGVLYSMILTCLGAYAFTKKDVPGLKAVFFLIKEIP